MRGIEDIWPQPAQLTLHASRSDRKSRTVKVWAYAAGVAAESLRSHKGHVNSEETMWGFLTRKLPLHPSFDSKDSILKSDTVGFPRAHPRGEVRAFVTFVGT